jgi:hypothetical protein
MGCPAFRNSPLAFPSKISHNNSLAETLALDHALAPEKLHPGPFGFDN